MYQGVAHGLAISVQTTVCKCQLAEHHLKLFHSTHIIHVGEYVVTDGQLVIVILVVVESVYAQDIVDTNW
jgi:hypothetical protein